MNKKRALVYLLLAILMIAGVFGPPMAGPGVRAAPSSSTYSTLDIRFIVTPPAVMCLGDTVQLTLAYTYKGYYLNNGGLTPNPNSSNGIYITASKGDARLASSRVNALVGSGIVFGSYRASELGSVTIRITSDSTVTTGTTSFSFTVQRCQKRLEIDATAVRIEGDAGIAVILFATGGIYFEPTTGVVSGGGPYRYSLLVTAPNCMEADPLNYESAYTVTGWTSNSDISFEVQFEPYYAPPVVLECDYDNNGTFTPLEFLPARELVPEFNWGTLIFVNGEAEKRFPYGPGEVRIRLINRK